MACPVIYHNEGIEEAGEDKYTRKKMINRKEDIRSNKKEGKRYTKEKENEKQKRGEEG